MAINEFVVDLPIHNTIAILDLCTCIASTTSVKVVVGIDVQNVCPEIGIFRDLLLMNEKRKKIDWHV